MSVVWSATSPVSGNFSAVEVQSDFIDLLERFNELRAQRQEYLEVGLPGEDVPNLTLGFRHDHAVIHVFEGP